MVISHVCIPYNSTFVLGGGGGGEYRKVEGEGYRPKWVEGEKNRKCVGIRLREGWNEDEKKTESHPKHQQVKYDCRRSGRPP